MRWFPIFLATGLTTLGAQAAEDNTLYLNCKCTSVYNSSLESQTQGCGLIADITVIVDFASGTVDLKTPNQPNSVLKGLSGPAAISPGTISAHWNSSPVSSYARRIDLAIDRTTGEYSLAWDFGETKIRWSGICKKGDPLPTQF